MKTIVIGALVAIIIVSAVVGFLVLNSRDDVENLTTTTTSIKTVVQSLDEQPKSEQPESEKPLHSSPLLEKITLNIPFDPEDPIQGIMPMGETIEHPDDGEFTGGHPGIDFQWYYHPDGRSKVFASAAGVIHLVEPDEDGAFDVTILHDDFNVITDTVKKTYYTLVGPIDSDFEFKVGDRIEAGSFLGYVHKYPPEKLPPNVYMIHWEFGFLETWISMERPPPEGWLHRNRLCPMTYFNEESRELLEEIWSRPDSYEHKGQFPYLCNNVYHGKNE